VQAFDLDPHGLQFEDQMNRMEAMLLRLLPLIPAESQETLHSTLDAPQRQSTSTVTNGNFILPK
jgi:hypothetical protein